MTDAIEPGRGRYTAVISRMGTTWLAHIEERPEINAFARTKREVMEELRRDLARYFVDAATADIVERLEDEKGAK